jgi:gamma-glutamyl-gamma-aminobutyrate hydrolase PuuD
LRICLITQRRESAPDRGETRDSLDRRLSLWVREAGLQPVPVPNIWLARGNDLQKWLTGIGMLAAILSGGGDPGDDPEREYTETGILKYAQGKQLPVLGICRGMQMMGVYAGASLVEVSGHVRARHKVEGIITGEVNSFHNKALSGCPLGYQITSRSEDGVLESIRHKTLPWEGWMWHPEREQPFAQTFLARFQGMLAG